MTTRTLNPLPFENLEPHRFEDLIRRLLYGFREWIDIEPTGRGGSDDGFDVRAWEKSEVVTNASDEGEEGERLTDGNLWQIQGKREKQVTPAKIKTIVQHDIDIANPPYGYILAAATNISKAAYDTFRQEARNRGVREFFFWGKDYLEDQLSLPANDEILFTFFGISLSPQRRSRTAEIKFGINNKNKILRLLFGNDSLIGRDGQVSGSKALLLRDIKDQHYPFKEHYKDFDTKRRWEEHDAVRVTSTGVYFKCREWYAYVDREKRTWDHTNAIDLVPRRHPLDKRNALRTETDGKRLERYWRHLPQRNQAKFMVFGFVAFDDMLIIESRTGKTYTFEDLQIIGENLRTLTYLRRPGKFFGFEGSQHQLEEDDLIRIPQEQGSNIEVYAEVTHRFTTSVSKYTAAYGEWEANRLKEYAGKELDAKDNFLVYEVIRVIQAGDHLMYCDYDY